MNDELIRSLDDKIDASNPRYGGFWNGTGNDSPAIQAAVDEAATSVRRRIVVLPPNVCLRDAVFVPINVTILGHSYVEGKVNTILTPHVDASFSTGFAFNLNTLDGATPRENVYNRPYVNRLSGIYVSNFSALKSGWGLVQAFGGTIISDIYASRMPRIIKKPNNNAGNNYTDNWIIERIHEYSDGAESFYNTDHAIDIGPVGTSNSGDALQINQLNFPMPAGAAPRKALRINRSTGARITNVINGSIALDDCSPVVISNYHSEYGQIIATRTDLSIIGASWAIKDGQTYYPIECYGQGGGTGSYSLSLKDVVFRYGLGSYRGGAGAEIKTSTQVAVYADNVKRVSFINGSEGSQTGIRLHTSAGASLTAWNDYSHFLSSRGTYVRDQGVGQHTQKLVADFNGAHSPFITGGVSTLGAGTKYYRAQYIAKLSPLEGRNSIYSEISQAISAGQCIGFSLSFGSNTAIAMVRFYRGTATGNYDFYVDIPCINATYLVDDGDTLCGWPWIPRTAGGMDAITLLAANYVMTPAGRVVVS